MKVSELFRRSLALLNEDESRARVFKRNCIPLVNQLLAQCLSTENAIREADGRPALKTAETVEGFDDTVPYDENFVSGCMPYGAGGAALRGRRPLDGKRHERAV